MCCVFLQKHASFNSILTRVQFKFKIAQNAWRGWAGVATALRGAGGCTAVSERWRQQRLSRTHAEDVPQQLQLLAVADSYNHRVVVLQIIDRPVANAVETVRGQILWSFTGVHVGRSDPATVGSSESPRAVHSGCVSAFAVPTCVCEPRPGLLAVTDRDNGRLVLLELTASTPVAAPAGDDSSSPVEATAAAGASTVGMVASRTIGGFLAPVGCCALPGGGVAVTDTGRGRVVVLSPKALQAEQTALKL